MEDEKRYDPKTHLSLADVTVDNAVSPSIIALNIKYSKTDQGRVGVRVILGRTGDDLCPVVALPVQKREQTRSAVSMARQHPFI